MKWVPGKANIGDALTKANSSTTEMLQLTMYTGQISNSFEDEVEKSSKQNTG